MNHHPKSPRSPGLVFRRPHKVGKYELPLGYALEPEAPVGFTKKARRTANQVAAYAGDVHGMVFARTGAGKGRSCAIPWLLHLDNAAVVLDVKGEAFLETAEYRRKALGHRIYVLDPFQRVGGTDTMNPFDLLRKDQIEVDAGMLAELLLDGKPPSKVDQFWDNMANSFLIGAIAHIATTADAPGIGQLRDLLQSDDVPHAIAAMLDQKKVPSALAHREFAQFCNHEGEKVRTSVLSTAQQHMRVFGPESVARSMGPSTLTIDEIMRGEKFTVYIVIPPENLASHGALLRLWIGMLLTAITRRPRLPTANTLFLLDEIGQCGRIAALRQAITLMRGYGVNTITLWQDLTQLQTTYEDSRSLLNNCAFVKTFGAANFEMASTMANVLGVTPQRLMSLPPANSLTHIVGHGLVELRRLDYATDAWFKGRAQPNPRRRPEDPGQERAME